VRLLTRCWRRANVSTALIGSVVDVAASIHRLLLALFRRLPERGRVAVVHLIAPMHSVGANGLIERDDGALLLVRHTYHERWGLPGGLAKRGELPRDTAVREVREEVGIRADVISEPAVVVEPGPRRVDIVFKMKVLSGEPHPVSPEIAEVAWFAQDQLPPMQDEAVAAIAAMARWTAAPT
jgi:8-oxo-dGTP diphosphatase